jgi:dethiobiotin synthetase
MKSKSNEDQPTHIFVTGTDTDVGKTVFTTCFLGWLRAQGVPSIGFKPLASGPRTDAESLFDVQAGEVPLDVINPWHFAEPLAPLLAARMEGRRVAFEVVVEHLKVASRGMQVAVTEGAGGLLSPMLEGGGDAAVMIDVLDASPVIVAVDRLGVVGQVRLVWSALSRRARQTAQVVLMESQQPDASVAGNRTLLGEYVGPERVHAFPRLGARELKAYGGMTIGPVCAAVAEGLGIGRA